MKKYTFATAVVFGLMMMACSASTSTSSSSSSGDDGGSNGGTAPTMASTDWVGPCNDAGPLGSPVAYSKVTLEFTSSTALTVDTKFYSDSCSTQTAEILVEGSYVIGSSTTLPANGWTVTTTLNSSMATTAEASGGSGTTAASVINGDCGVSVLSTTTSATNWGYPSFPNPCSSDTRFSTIEDSAVANMVIVVDGTTLSTTAMDSNSPGVSGSPASSTTLSFTKL